MMIKTLALCDPDLVAGCQLLREGTDERALADPWLAGDKQHLASAAERLLEAAAKLFQLGRAADQSRRLGRHERRRARTIDRRCDRQHQAVAAPMPGFDIARMLGIVAERAPQLLDAGRER